MDEPKDNGAFDLPDGSLLEREFLARLRWFATRWLGDAHAGEDAAQEAMKRVIQAVVERRVRDRQALPAFAFQTVRFVCSHHFRAAGREQRMLSGYGSERRCDEPGEDPLNELVSVERRRQVQGALAAMPEEDRKLLKALFIDEESPREVAAKLRLTEGALRTRKHRALKRLGRHLSDLERRQ